MYVITIASRELFVFLGGLFCLYGDTRFYYALFRMRLFPLKVSYGALLLGEGTLKDG